MDEQKNAPAAYEVVYYTDPLCCWSFGMQKHWQRLLQTYGAAINKRYCMGGLLPDWDHYNDPQHMVSRPVQMGPVWMEAAHLTDTPIQSRIWMEDPPVSSYLACIAVKCAAMQSTIAEENYLNALWEAVMLEGKNISYATSLISVAENLATRSPGVIDSARLADDLVSGSGMEAFKRDLAEVRDRGINRFPSLIIRASGKNPVIITGYRSYEALVEVFESLR